MREIIYFFLFFACFIFAGCSKEKPQGKPEEPSTQIPRTPRQGQDQQVKQPLAPYYRYLDPAMPATLAGPTYVVEELLVNYEHRDNIAYEAHGLLYLDSLIALDDETRHSYYQESSYSPIDVDFYIRLYNKSELEEELVQHETGDYKRMPPLPGFRGNFASSFCYDEIPYIAGRQGVKQITQHLWEKQQDNSFVKKTIPAELQVYIRSTEEDSPDSEYGTYCPEGYTCEQEIQWILPQLPPGIIPPDQSVVIEASYFILDPQDSEEVKAAKKKANSQICEVLKSIAWIPAAGTPPKWETIPGLDDYPKSKIVTEEIDKTK